VVVVVVLVVLVVLVVVVVVVVAVAVAVCKSACRNILVFHSGSAHFCSQWRHQVC